MQHKLTQMIIEEDVDIRLDKYLKEKTPISRNVIETLIKEGNILVNNKITKKSYFLRKDDKIEIKEPIQEDKFVPWLHPLDVLYEDDDVLVINKPSGITVHPGAGNKAKTLLNIVFNYYLETKQEISESRLGLVHRLDKNTSGTILFAKNLESLTNLQNQFKERTVIKKYIALCKGRLPKKSVLIKLKIGDGPDFKKMVINGSNPKAAITQVKELKYFHNSDVSLIECELLTGRTHQIRLHLEFIGNPILNDNMYSPNYKESSKYGQYLHSFELAFLHPKTKEKMVFYSPLDEIFISKIKILLEKEV